MNKIIYYIMGVVFICTFILGLFDLTETRWGYYSSLSHFSLDILMGLYLYHAISKVNK